MKIRDRSTLSLFDARHDITRAANPPAIRVWVDPDEPDGDSFAGGGGAKLGIKQAYERLGIQRRAPGIAVNHWPEALAMYAANHPECRVLCEDVVKVNPALFSGGKRYALAWFSPTCIFFSQARGGPLDEEEATRVRGLANVMIDWAKSEARPRVSCLENVKPFQDWGPLHRQHSNGCSTEVALERGTAQKNGKITPKCLKGCCYARPIKARKGEFYRAFVAELSLYYRHVEGRVLKACDYGAPTSRERFFLIASDEPAQWPAPTHGPGKLPKRTAAECIDWSIECPSIFERAKSLAEKTLARIRAGIERFVFGAARPFVVHLTHGSRHHDIDESAPTLTCANRGELGIVSPLVMKAKTYGGGGNDAKPTDTQLGTITTSKRGEHAIATPIVTKFQQNSIGQDTREPLHTVMAGATRFGIATPFLVHRSNGERGATETTKAQAPRVYDAQKPIGTLMAQGQKHALAMPVLIKNNGGNNDRCGSAGQAIETPLDTIATRDQKSIAMLHLLKLRGTSESHVAASAHPIDAELPTISASGTHFAQVAAIFMRFDGSERRQETTSLDDITYRRALRVAKFLGYDAPVILVLDGEEWVLVDIGFRMLVPRELFRCQGFPNSWRIEIDYNGKPLTKTAQIKCVGNSVPPQLAEAVAIAAIRTIRYDAPIARAA